jgi:hypothetical protein
VREAAGQLGGELLPVERHMQADHEAAVAAVAAARRRRRVGGRDAPELLLPIEVARA